MSYRIDIQVPNAHPVACSLHPSAVPGETVCANEDGSALCVEPDGSQVRMIPAGDPAWDSPYTRGVLSDGFLIYQSATPDTSGTPRGYRIVP